MAERGIGIDNTEFADVGVGIDNGSRHDYATPADPNVPADNGGRVYGGYKTQGRCDIAHLVNHALSGKLLPIATMTPSRSNFSTKSGISSSVPRIS
jgi:hypothetical protein